MLDARSRFGFPCLCHFLNCVRSAVIGIQSFACFHVTLTCQVATYACSVARTLVMAHNHPVGRETQKAATSSGSLYQSMSLWFVIGENSYSSIERPLLTRCMSILVAYSPCYPMLGVSAASSLLAYPSGGTSSIRVQHWYLWWTFSGVAGFFF